jgi:hypothetical protein
MDDLTMFCDDCGAQNHTWENCPLTRDMDIPLRNPAYNDSEMGIFEGYGEYDDEPADIDDDHGMNPYDGTYDYMEDAYDYF